MCGIVLLYSSSKPEKAGKFKKSLASIYHRGPDASEIFYKNDQSIVQLKDDRDDLSTVFLGHTRLSIIDLSTGSQPMVDETGNYAIVFNGEIFNYRDLRDELIGKYGFNFKTTSDTEVLLKGLIQEGASFLDKCNGMWAFGLYNLKENTLLLSRDRYGIKPLYYSQIDNIIIFASEIKALLQYRSPLENKNIVDFYRKTGISDFSAETFFEGIFQLLPGHNMRIKSDQNDRLDITIDEWYKFVQKNISPCSLDEYYIHYRELLHDSIKIRLESDVEVGALLSGGIDSSIVVGVASKFYNNSPFRTYSGISQNPHFDESFWVDEVVKFNGEVTNEKINLESNVTSEEIDRVILAMESPFSTSSIISQNRLFRAIQPSGIKVILDGQGSDEINLGYDKYFGYAIRQLVRNGKIKKAFNYTKDLLSYQSNTHALLHFINAFTPSGLSDRFRSLIGYSSYKEVNNMLFLSKNMDLFEFEKLLYQKMLLPIHLRYLDRNSMQYSIEARSPFLDHRLVEFLLALPVNVRLGEGRRKGMLLQVAKNDLPLSIFGRKDKIGFKSDDQAILKTISTESLTFKNYTIERWQTLFFGKE